MWRSELQHGQSHHDYKLKVRKLRKGRKLSEWGGGSKYEVGGVEGVDARRERGGAANAKVKIENDRKLP